MTAENSKTDLHLVITPMKIEFTRVRLFDKDKDKIEDFTHIGTDIY